jgi:glycosyltransferase involved in cell wall biosynthesis
MIIGIDVSAIPYGTGVSSYTLNLVRHLLRIDKTNIYKLFFSSLRQPLPPEIQELKGKKNVKVFHFRLPPTFLEVIWNQLYVLPIELFIGKCDVFHTWDWYQPPSLNAKIVTTVHDLIPFLYPQWQHPKTITTFKRKFNQATRHPTSFICVSQNTRTDLLKLFPNINSKNITIIYEAAEDKYCPQTKDKIQKVKKIYGLNSFILAQGTREPRKNLDRRIKAFIKFKELHPQNQTELAITGKYGWGQDITHPQHSYIKILGYIPEKDMPSLHSAALCLAYPSLYEGFGLPVIKSLKVGTPVITSNTSSLPEVAGNATILVNPTSVKEITLALTKIITQSNLRQQLKSISLAQAKKFSWTITARQTLSLYQSLIK